MSTSTDRFPTRKAAIATAAATISAPIASACRPRWTTKARLTSATTAVPTSVAMLSAPARNASGMVLLRGAEEKARYGRRRRPRSHRARRRSTKGGLGGPRADPMSSRRIASTPTPATTTIRTSGRTRRGSRLSRARSGGSCRPACLRSERRRRRAVGRRRRGASRASGTGSSGSRWPEPRRA